MKDFIKRNSLFMIPGFTIFMLMGISFSLWILTLSQEGTNEIASTCFGMTMTNEKNDITLTNTIPLKDEDGEKLTPFEFTVNNTCNSLTEYNIGLEIQSNSEVPAKYIKVQIDDKTPIILSELPTISKINNSSKEAYKILGDRLNGVKSRTHKVRIWIDEKVTADNTEVVNKRFASKITLQGNPTNKYIEDILNGTDPVINGDLIPVTIASDGTVTRADENKKWYSYADKEWANAIILNNPTTINNYRIGDTIPESEIESYFVWIPRYKYQIFNDGNYSTRTAVENRVQLINIEFESKDTEVSNGSTVGSWLTHPAFVSFNANGMWIGKFETGKKSGADNVIAPNQVQVKPNVNSWRSIQVANAFYTTYDYKRNLDSHMMKNTEWGAVAYLSMSNYGRGVEDIRMNNNSNYITGYAAVNAPTCGYTGDNQDCNKYGTSADITKPYNTDIGVLASTAGNITGIYDMSGGTWEYVMGVMLDIRNTKPVTGPRSSSNSNFNGPYSNAVGEKTNGLVWPSSKYYDTYVNYTNNDRFNRRILGDATGEMGPFGTATYGSQTRNISSWYGDLAYFVVSGTPWFRRGANYENGTNAGIGAFYDYDGSTKGTNGFRLVLTP